jgi:hypothetical protein
MKVYLAGFKTLEKHYDKPTNDVCILSSFFEHKNGKFGDYVYGDNHILDSGAFSFFGGKTVDWDDYVKKYCDFIKKTNQNLFFELDIDKVTSLQHAEQLRNTIEQTTGKQPIPVWRPSRGIDYWHQMCEDYSYVAISASGFFDSSWTRTKEAVPVIKKMLSIAHRHNAKVHGLGYTVMKNLKILKFDSIDSTTWLNAVKFGELQWFANGKINKKQARQINKKTIKSQEKNMLKNNFNEWIKFQKYAENEL